MAIADYKQALLLLDGDPSKAELVNKTKGNIQAIYNR